MYEERKSDGAFDGTYVRINEKSILPMTGNQILKTVIHELRHAYQGAAIDNPNLYVVSQETRNAWKENLSLGNYISYEEDKAAYRAQPVEWDAQNFAMQKGQIDEIDRDLVTYEGSWTK